MPYAQLQARHDEMVEMNVEFKNWQYALLKAPCKNPVGCCYGLFCMCCFAYQQRNRILDNVGIPYRPCGGFCCCFPTPICDDSPVKQCCMCCESFCCPYIATLANRDLIMYHYQVNFDKCDEMIISCVICLDCIFGILALIDENFRSIKDILDLLLMIIMSCSLAQQESTLDVATGNPTCCGGNYQGEAYPPAKYDQGPELGVGLR